MTKIGVSLIIAYLLGSIPFSFLMGKLSGRVDLSTKGSGNLGGTNAIRVLGWVPGLIAGGLDVAKAFGAVWLANLLCGSVTVTAVAALTVTAGHNWSVFFMGQKGGKGISTTIGAFLFISPWVVLGAAVMAIAVILIFRRVSLGSLIFALLLPVGLLMMNAAPAVLLSAALLTIVAFWRHRENIRRLGQGVERTVDDKEA